MLPEDCDAVDAIDAHSRHDDRVSDPERNSQNALVPVSAPVTVATHAVVAVSSDNSLQLSGSSNANNKSSRGGNSAAPDINLNISVSINGLNSNNGGSALPRRRNDQLSARQNRVVRSSLRSPRARNQLSSSNDMALRQDLRVLAPVHENHRKFQSFGLWLCYLAVCFLMLAALWTALAHWINHTDAIYADADRVLSELEPEGCEPRAQLVQIHRQYDEMSATADREQSEDDARWSERCANSAVYNSDFTLEDDVDAVHARFGGLTDENVAAAVAEASAVRSLASDCAQYRQRTAKRFAAATERIDALARAKATAKRITDGKADAEELWGWLRGKLGVGSSEYKRERACVRWRKAKDTRQKSRFQLGSLTGSLSAAWFDVLVQARESLGFWGSFVWLLISVSLLFPLVLLLKIMCTLGLCNTRAAHSQAPHAPPRIQSANQDQKQDRRRRIQQDQQLQQQQQQQAQ